MKLQLILDLVLVIYDFYCCFSGCFFSLIFVFENKYSILHMLQESLGNNEAIKKVILQLEILLLLYVAEILH